MVIEDDIKGTYPEGSSVFPGIICNPALKNNKVELTTEQVGYLSLYAVEVYGDSQIPRENDSYVPELYEGRPVYPFDHNWTEGAEILGNRAGGVIASGRGEYVDILGDHFSTLSGDNVNFDRT